MTVATMLINAQRKHTIAIGIVRSLETGANGVNMIESSDNGKEIMKKPNWAREAIRTNLSASVMSVGIAIVAPASSSLSRISIGLNQYSVFGLLQ